MHPYSIESKERQSVPFFLAVGASAAVVAGRGLLSTYLPDWSFAIYVPSGFALYGMLYVGFDRFMWTTWPLRRAGICQVPDLNGTWNGVLRSSHSEFGREHPATLRVHQTWSRIRLTFETPG